MKDDTTKVKIYKNEYVKTATSANADSGKPVVGSTLQILNEDKTPALYHGEEIIFTTGEIYKLFEKTLLAGKTYWLHEVKPAPGYAYAEDVKFRVSTDGSVDVVLMEDKPTDVSLSKKSISGNEELPGNHMQLVDKNGTVIDQWTSGDKPHRIVGKLEADHEYRLIETSPKPGYAYAEDIVFTVNHDGTPNFVEMRDDVTKVEILKVSAGSGMPLAGAEFELRDQSGTVIETWTSTQEPHQIYGKLSAGESYILHESKAPSGYKQMADVTITVNHFADILKVTAENSKTPGGGHNGGGSNYSIRIRKLDENGKSLAGAAFKVTDENGKQLSVTKEMDGTVFKISVKNPQTLTISEIGAPDGYEKLEGTYQIEIPASGDALLLNGDDKFYQDSKNSYVFFAVNEKTPPEIPSTTPNQPGERPNKGKITASFDSGQYGFGNAKLNYNGTVIDLTAKTGDDFPALLLCVVAVISLIGMLGAAFMYFRKNKNNPKNKPPKGGASSSPHTVVKAFIFCMLSTALLQLGGLDTLAAQDLEMETADVQYRERTYLSDTDNPEKQNQEFDEFITVDGRNYVLDSVSYEVESKKRTEDSAENVKVITSEPFTDTQEKHTPENEITEGGETYYLQSYETVETVLDARTEPVSDTITYPDHPVEGKLPEAAKLSVKDSITGDSVEVQVPLTDVNYGEVHWVSGFEFPITVSDYDASMFDLNGKEVPLSEDAPLKGYESDLLQMIGVSENAYRINHIEWDGEAYTDNGILCRKLKATGDMLVQDCDATYSGVVNLPEVQAKAIQAVYADRPVATDSDAESGYTYTMKATVKYISNTETLAKKTFLDRLIDFITNPIVVAVILTLLLIILILWLLSKKRKKEEEHIYISDGDSTDDE